MILLLAADDSLHDACRRTLSEAGHRTLRARTAHEARDLLARTTPDLVLVDGELAERSAALLAELHVAGRPTLVLLNRSELEEALATVDAIAAPEGPASQRRTA